MSSTAAAQAAAAAANPASIFSIARDGSLRPPPAQPKGRRRARLLQQQQQQQSQSSSAASSSPGSSLQRQPSFSNHGGSGSRSTDSSALALSWRRGQRWSFSTHLLLAIAALWLGAAALMAAVPETQALLTYLHWVRWPLFRDLGDLRGFRLEVRFAFCVLFLVVVVVVVVVVVASWVSSGGL